jgi:hypothetical protein
MKWISVLILLLFAIGLWSAVAEEPPTKAEPPVRLRKKEKPNAAEKGPPELPPANPSKEKEAPPPLDPPQDEAAILARLSRNLQACEDRLAKNDAGATTRGIQQEVLHEIDSLIKDKQRPRQPGQQQSSSGDAKAQSKSPPSPQPPFPQDQLTKSKSPRRQETPKNPGPNGGEGRRKPREEGATKIADLYKDVWGHLPEKLRQEMDQYAREQFMAKYTDLLRQYYATIAEKGHRKGE